MKALSLPSGKVLVYDNILSYVRATADINFTMLDSSVVTETFANADVAKAAMQRIINYAQEPGDASGIIFNAKWEVLSATPNSGVAAGGTTTVIAGNLFQPWHQVTIGGLNVASQTFVDSSHFSVVTPAHAAGAVDVIVSDVSASVTLAGGYTYV